MLLQMTSFHSFYEWSNTGWVIFHCIYAPKENWPESLSVCSFNTDFTQNFPQERGPLQNQGSSSLPAFSWGATSGSHPAPLIILTSLPAAPQSLWPPALFPPWWCLPQRMGPVRQLLRSLQSSCPENFRPQVPMFHSPLSTGACTCT